MRKNASNQRGTNSVTVAPWHRDAGRFESCISRKLYLEVSSWILNGSSQKFCNEQTQVECIISIFSESLRISVDKTYAELRGMHINLQRDRSR